MAYIDGFVLAVKKDRLEDYKRIARQSGEIFKEHGAIEVVECVADDVPYGELTSFPRAVMATDDEIVIFAWITYPSKQVRDEAMAKSMADERLVQTMKDAPVDGKRMIFGGFERVIEL